MSTFRICVGVYATVLLAASLKGQPAGAKNCYATFADHLYRATNSSELIDNIKQAGSLLSEQPDAKEDLSSLVQAFASLKGDPNNAETFCSKENLINLRRVAEGLRDGGNLDLKEIAPGLARLNTIVIWTISEAREICHPFLTGKWPNPWEPKFSDQAMKGRIFNLHRVSPSYLYEGFFLVAKRSQTYEHIWQASSISYAIYESEMDNPNSIDPDEPQPLYTVNTVVIAKQLDEYVYKPCLEFVALEEAKEVLEPFNDMIKSSHVVTSRVMNEAYSDYTVNKLQENFYNYNYNREVRNYAHSYQACKRFLATPKSELAEMISQFRITHTRNNNRNQN